MVVLYIIMTLVVMGSNLIESKILGPPPGARGTIDFRYPDYIVDPLPPCPEVGVYPHPANCTWYYRCYTHATIGSLTFFRRSYFECEPGTSFSDELDQCIFPHDTNKCPTSPPPPPPPPCEINGFDCRNHEDCSPTKVSPGLIYLCETAFKVCSPNDEMIPYCSIGQLYEPVTERCRSNPETECKCEEKHGNCKVFELCQNSDDPSEVELCAEALKCTEAREQIPRCPPKLFYDVSNDRCVNPDLYKCPKCSDAYSGCKIYNYCPNGNEEQKYLCPSSVKFCDGQQPVQICQENEYYEYHLGRCVQDPSTQTCRNSVSEVTHTNTIRCSSPNTYPYEEWMKGHCSRIQYCSSKAWDNLCKKFYQCVETWNGDLQPNENECPVGQLFSFTNLRCVTKPQSHEICDQEFDLKY